MGFLRKPSFQGLCVCSDLSSTSRYRAWQEWLVLSKIAWMVFFPPRLALHSRIQCGMNMQNWPGHNFCRSACISTVRYLAADWVWVALHPLGNFPWVFCLVTLTRSCSKICCAFHTQRQLHFRSGVMLRAEPPFFSRHLHLRGTAGPWG